jgi:hypothetical protein
MDKVYTIRIGLSVTVTWVLSIRHSKMPKLLVN